MKIQLPDELHQYIQNEVRAGRFASEDEALAEAVRLLKVRPHCKPSSTSTLTEDDFERQLVAAGFISCPPKHDKASAAWKFQAISLAGEPLSETIIRDRG